MSSIFYEEDDRIIIYHGNCYEILPNLEGIKSIVTDPPYGISWNCDYTHLKNGNKYKPIKNDNKDIDITFLLKYKSVAIFGANYFNFPKGGFLIWDKRHKTKKRFMSEAEVAWCNTSTSCYIFEYMWQGLIRDGNEKDFLHPTQKPIAVMSWIIDKIKAESIICDPFMGVGSTLLAARNMGKKAIGIELEEEYCEKAAKRLSQMRLF